MIYHFVFSFVCIIRILHTYMYDTSIIVFFPRLLLLSGFLYDMRCTCTNFIIPLVQLFLLRIIKKLISGDMVIIFM